MHLNNLSKRCANCWLFNLNDKRSFQRKLLFIPIYSKCVHFKKISQKFLAHLKWQLVPLHSTYFFWNNFEASFLFAKLVQQIKLDMNNYIWVGREEEKDEKNRVKGKKREEMSKNKLSR
jgi:hypothetical protein